MSNTSRAGGYSQNLLGAVSCWFAASCTEAACFLVVDNLQELFFALCSNECLLEVIVHNHGGQLLKELDVSISCALWRCNHKEETSRVAIQGLKINACWNSHSCQCCLLYACTLGMRGRNAIAEAGGAGCLSCKNILEVLLLVGNAAALFHEVSQLIDSCALVSWSCADLDTLRA